MTSNDSPAAPRPRRSWHPALPIAALVALNLVLGFVLAPHYGQSTDEQANLIFARNSLESYRHPQDPYVDVSREDKGPFYLMVWLRVGEFLDRVVPGWLSVDGRHYANFLAFQLAIVSVYALALRFVRPGAALAGALLFEAQPVLFGHAFINQKDTPFMAFFALSVVLGMSMVDRSAAGARGRSPWPPGPTSTGVLADVKAAWPHEPRRARRTALLLGLCLLVPVGSLLLYRPLVSAAEALVTAAYRGEAWAPIQQAFLRLAEHAGRVPVEDYIRRGTQWTGLAILLGSVLLLGTALLVAGRLWPEGARATWAATIRETRQGLGGAWTWLMVPAAVVLGMTLAIRSTAIFAVVVVAVYGLIRYGPRVVIPLVLWAAAAAVVTFALWPQLWGAPFDMFAASLGKTVVYPELRRTLFEGVVYLSDELPWWYLPKTMAIQFTLPALAVMSAGLAGMIRLLTRRGPAGPAAWALMLWFLAPFLAVTALKAPIYNYFRHVLFMMPPLFVAASIALEVLMRWMRLQVLGFLLIAALLLPGAWSIVRLHPYEYGYFNEFVGGLRGSYGLYMPDYWCTSFREAMTFINGYAPASANIAVDGPRSNASPFARGDLHLGATEELVPDGTNQAVLALGCNWATVDPDFYPNAPIVWSVEREGVPLALVKLVAPTGAVSP
ncbi:MAG TPA: hypothetical protein VLD63_04475 [Anaerolineales bacterium]|nr:hypothetical protein [Anaerolineales bacterium]